MSQPLVLVSSMATRHMLAALLADYRNAAGSGVELQAMGGVDAAERVRAGQAADIILLAAGAMTKLAEDGHIVAGSITPFARSGMAIAVQAGTPAPDISSGGAVRAAMLAARAVGYSTGPSGDHLRRLWDGWGIAAAMAQRAVQAPPGVPVARLVASGQVTLGVQQLSELLGQPGITIAGPLPEDIQSTTVFAAGVATASQRPAEAREVLAHLAGADAAAVIERFGMAPP